MQIGGAGLAAGAIELGLVDELHIFRNPVLVGGGTPLLPPVIKHVPLDLIETRTFGYRITRGRRDRRSGGFGGRLGAPGRARRVDALAQRV